MTTLKQIYFAKWSKEEQKELKKEINEEFEQNFKPLVKEWLQQKQKEPEFWDNEQVFNELLEELEK